MYYTYIAMFVCQKTPLDTQQKDVGVIEHFAGVYNSPKFRAQGKSWKLAMHKVGL